MIRKVAHFSGQVQGVGFRYTAQALARDFAISGNVRNLPDGRVRLEAEGDEREIDRFLEAIHDHMGAYIHNIETASQPATGEFPDFRIVH